MKIATIPKMNGQITSRTSKAERKKQTQKQRNPHGYEDSDDSEDEYEQEYPNGMKVIVKGFGPAKILQFVDKKYKVKYDADGSTYHVEPHQIILRSSKAERKKQTQRQRHPYEDSDDSEDEYDQDAEDEYNAI